MSLINLLFIAIVITPVVAYSRAQLSPVRIRSRLLSWRTIASLSDAANWEPEQRLPCHRDRVILPEWFATYLNFQLEAREVVMPSNGLLLLGNEGGIRLATDDYDRWQYQCPEGSKGVDMHFNPQRVSGETAWYDGRHWSLAFDQGPSSSATTTRGRIVSSYATFMHYRGGNGPNDEDDDVRVVPHYERIPCAYDRIYLPTNGSYRMRVYTNVWAPTPTLVTVGGRLRLADTISMIGFLRSVYGKLMFDEGAASEDFGGGRGEFQEWPPRGSPLTCDNGRPTSAAMLCTYVRCSRSPPCRDPIQPWGFCCPICGSVMLVRPRSSRKANNKDNLIAMFDRIEKALGLPGSKLAVWPKVQFYLHWLDDESALQLVVGNLPDAEPETSRWYLQSVRVQLQKVERQFNITLHMSFDWILLESGGHGLLIFLLLLLLCSMSSVVGYFYYHQHHVDPAFTFVRFRSNADDIELEAAGAGAGPGERSTTSSVSYREAPRSLRNLRQPQVLEVEPSSPVVLESLDIAKISARLTENYENKEFQNGSDTKQ